MQDHEIHLNWYRLAPVHTDGRCDDPLLDCVEILDARERQRAARFHFEKDRVLFQVAHVFLRQVVADYVGTSASALTFRTTQSGRPVLADAASNTSFSLSHTNGAVAVAVARMPHIGIDIEQIRPGAATQAAIRQHLSPRELKELNDLPHDEFNRRHYQLWTLKEAYGKARESGLRYDLASVQFEFCDRQIFVSHPPRTNRLTNWHCYSEYSGDWAISAAANSSRPVDFKMFASHFADSLN